MRVTHPVAVTVECPAYACTLAVDDHEGLHNDETTGVWWPVHTDGSER